MLTPVGAPERLTDSEFAALRTLIRRAVGIHLTDSKRELVASRLARRLRHYGFRRYGQYYEQVTRHDPRGEELRELVNCITTNKTSFFREPHHFEYLRRTVLSGGRAELAFWCAGCSTGEEAYTLALVARDALGAAEAQRRVHILASDIDTRVLETARAGLYGDAGIGDVPAHLRRAGFLRGTGSHAGRALVRPEVRRLVEFRQVNLIDPLTWPEQRRFQVIFCRNVIIYFDAETRRELIERFARRLVPGGLLVLGHSESLHEQSFFEAVGTTIYRLRDGAPQERMTLPPAVLPPLPGPRPALATPSGDMTLRPDARLQHESVGVGGVAASAADAELRTLLGSGVAACLFDPASGVGGMTHFLLPHSEAGPLHHDHALERLIEEIERLGGSRSRLQAKCFGGACMPELDAPGVAPQDAGVVREYLAAAGIPLVAERLGGARALEVRMQTRTGRVLVRELGGLAAQRAWEEERFNGSVLPPSDPEPASNILTPST